MSKIDLRSEDGTWGRVFINSSLNELLDFAITNYYLGLTISLPLIAIKDGQDIISKSSDLQKLLQTSLTEKSLTDKLLIIDEVVITIDSKGQPVNEKVKVKIVLFSDLSFEKILIASVPCAMLAILGSNHLYNQFRTPEQPYIAYFVNEKYPQLFLEDPKKAWNVNMPQHTTKPLQEESKDIT